MIASKYKGDIVLDFNPTDPGDHFSVLYNTSLSSKDKPLIVLLDEVDSLLKKIFNGNVMKHKLVHTQVIDKPSWNKFLDYFDRLIFPYVILIMTSNRTAEEIDSMDSSFLRSGRVNLKTQLN
jgi:hypothetical protein